MATLEVSFGCMVLFAPDPTTGTVHVIMPATMGMGGEGEHCCEPHVVRILHPSFGPDEEKGRPMEGWELVLGQRGNAETSLDAMDPAEEDEQYPGLADLSRVSGLTLPRQLIEEKRHHKVAARVTLLEGEMRCYHSEAEWRYHGRDRSLAFLSTWVIRNLEREDISWRSIGAEGEPPVDLYDLEDESGLIQISIYHTLEDCLPPPPLGSPGSLEPAEVQRHFRSFFKLQNVDPTPEHWLPAPSLGIMNSSCLGSRALLSANVQS